MNDHHARIARLQAEIAQLESELTDLEAEILDLERELGDFVERYDQLVRPISEKLAVIRQMIADLENEHAPPPPQLGQPPTRPTLASSWTPPPDYVSVEEQYRRAWEVPRQQAAAQPPPEAPVTRPAAGSASESGIRKLYRQLARRYHPDLTTDPAERQRRNRLMAEINEAYSRRDSAALQALAAQPEAARTDQPWAALQVRQLEQIRAQLDRRLYHLRVQRNELIHGEMMDLKLQASFAAREGRDLLAEMAARLQREYDTCLDRLDQLRGS